jgi:hyperosmotically inducible protein
MRTRILAVVAALTLAAAPTLLAKSLGTMVDDGTITTSVKTALLENKNTHSTKINVESFNGVVQLSGFVATQAEKTEAGRVAKGVSGVKQLRNDIAIMGATSMGTKLDDSMLTSKVKTALIEESKIKANDINVETRGGTVQLAGFVSSKAVRDRAGVVAAGVKGVNKVDNVLIVKPK